MAQQFFSLPRYDLVQNSRDDAHGRRNAALHRAVAAAAAAELMEDLLNGEAHGYRWGQTLEDVTVHIDVGPSVLQGLSLT